MVSGSATTTTATTTALRQRLSTGSCGLNRGLQSPLGPVGRLETDAAGDAEAILGHRRMRFEGQTRVGGHQATEAAFGARRI